MAPAKATRYSMQRELILAEVLQRKDHPDAEAIYQSVKKTCPAISLGTVYRNLNLLVKDGKIRRVVMDREIFDSTLKPHYHMRCVKCGSVFDVDIPYLTEIEAQAHKGSGFVVLSHDVKFFGVCKHCMDNVQSK